MLDGTTIEVSKADVGGPNDGASEVNIEIVAPSKAKKKLRLGGNGATSIFRTIA